MAAILENGRHSKLYLTISLSIMHIEPWLLCLHPCFGGQRIHWSNLLMIRNMPNVKLRPFFQNGRHSKLYLTSHSNLNVTISQPVLHIEPSYLCLHPCFGGQRIHWNNFLMTRNMPNVKLRPFSKMAAIQNLFWLCPQCI